jgi:hypothetical protein
VIVCSCNERMTEEELPAHRDAGCLPLERNIRRLAAKRKRPWQSEAKCGGYDVAWFLPEDGSRRTPIGSGLEVDGIRFKRLTHQERLAKSQWCVRCPVREECLDFAFETRSEHVIFGGATWDERRLVLHLAPEDRLRVLEELLARQCMTEGLVPARALSATGAPNEDNG